MQQSCAATHARTHCLRTHGAAQRSTQHVEDDGIIKKAGLSMVYHLSLPPLSNPYTHLISFPSVLSHPAAFEAPTSINHDKKKTWKYLTFPVLSTKSLRDITIDIIGSIKIKLEALSPLLSTPQFAKIISTSMELIVRGQAPCMFPHHTLVMLFTFSSEGNQEHMQRGHLHDWVVLW